MENYKARAWAEIDLDAIAHNVKSIKKFVGKNTKILCVVKANAYGHGIEEIARFVQRCGVDYLGVAIAIAMAWFLRKSRIGLQLRAVGESAGTADAAGINVTRYKYLATIIGGGISSIGGMVYIMTIAGCVWNHEGLAGEGWLAVALVIFCLWRPLNAIWGSILFGALMIMYVRIQLPFIPDQLYKILPYVVTVIVLIFTSMRNSRDKQPPANLGLAYFREER